MRQAGRKMNLRVHICFLIYSAIAKSFSTQGHRVGMHGKLTKLHAPVDIEGHKGSDGLYYVVVRR